MHDPSMTFFDKLDISWTTPKFKFFMIESEQVKYRSQPIVMVDDSINCMVGECCSKMFRESDNYSDNTTITFTTTSGRIICDKNSRIRRQIFTQYEPPMV